MVADVANRSAPLHRTTLDSTGKLRLTFADVDVGRLHLRAPTRSRVR
jgi:hypothetical protein